MVERDGVLPLGAPVLDRGYTTKGHPLGPLTFTSPGSRTAALVHSLFAPPKGINPTRECA